MPAADQAVRAERSAHREGLSTGTAWHTTISGHGARLNAESLIQCCKHAYITTDACFAVNARYHQYTGEGCMIWISDSVSKVDHE